MMIPKHLLSRAFPVGLLAISLAGSLHLSSTAWPAEDSQLFSYGSLVQQANTAMERGDLTVAIQTLEKAMSIAPEMSVTVVQNNLAALYMKRGNFYLSKQKNPTLAAGDFRQAYYLLEYAWPEGVSRKPLHENNRKIAKENLGVVYDHLKISPNEKAAHLKLAKELRLQGKFQESIVEYARLLELEKQNPEALKALGDLFNVLSNPEKAKKYYAQLVTLPGGQAKEDVLLSLANAQQKAGEVERAIENLNKALVLNPGNVGALNLLESIWKTEVKFNPASVLGHANLAGVYQKQKRYEEALNQYYAAEHFASQDPQTTFETKKLIRLNIGTLFQETHKYPQALQAYDTVLQSEPNHLLATYYKATLFKESSQPEESLRWYRRVLAIDPNYDLAHRDLLEMIKKQPTPEKVAIGLKSYANDFSQNALVQSKVGEEFHRLKDLDNAAIYYQRAISLKPDVAGTYANLGAVYQAQGKVEESLVAFKKASQLDPNNETVHKLTQQTQEVAGYELYQKAVALQQEDKTQEAIPLLEKAASLSPQNMDFRLAYGVALQHGNQLPEALAQYQKVLQQQPENAQAYYYLGTVYHQQQQIPQALQAYQKAVSLDASLTDAKQAISTLEQTEVAQWLEKALADYNQKRYPQALQSVQQVLKKDPNNATAFYYKGLLLNAQKQVEGALQSYRQAVRLNPQFSDAYYAMAVILDTRQDRQGAKQAYEKFIELSPTTNDDFTQYAKQRLSQLK